MATFESDLARKFAPIYHSSRNERNYLAQLEPESQPRLALAHPPWRPFVYFCMVEVETSDGERAYEINYLTIWDWDSGTLGGLGEHHWDTERTAILVAGPEESHDPSEYAARQAYYAAHEGVRLGGLLSVDNSQYVRYRGARDSGDDVYWSTGKHASFRNLGTLRHSTAHDSYRRPGHVARPGEYTLVDVGSLQQPSAAAPWIMHRKGWGPQRISSVYSKLKDRLWDAAGNRLRPISKVTEDQLMQIQAKLNVPQTGQLDEETLRQTAARLPSYLVWTTREITEADVTLMADRGIDVSDLV